MSKPIHVLIKDTETGEQRTYVFDYPKFDWTMDDWGDDGSETFMWSEGNYGCDCNRGLFFAEAGGADDPDAWCGHDRFYIRITAPDGTVLFDEMEKENG